MWTAALVPVVFQQDLRQEAIQHQRQPQVATQHQGQPRGQLQVATQHQDQPQGQLQVATQHQGQPQGQVPRLHQLLEESMVGTWQRHKEEQTEELM